MKCIYDDGEECTLWDKSTDSIDDAPNACCTESGACTASDDPNPDWCIMYETNDSCDVCGADGNNEEIEPCSC